MVVKTFRGLLADGGMDRLRVSTVKGKVGYKIVKFRIIPKDPGNQDYETTVTVYKSSFTPANSIELTDPKILAVGYWSGHASLTYPQVSQYIIIDNQIFNQDIYVGSKDIHAHDMNYYIELEVVNLDESQAEYTTIKDIRTQKQ